MDWTGCEEVEMNPAKVSGVPILVHSRVMADQVLDSAEAGESVEEIAHSFELPADQVRQVLAFAATRSVATIAP